ncbi:MAG: sugar transferase [Deltaproteobacteria bacterium]|nr:sugar transferase [Deltaproteobacteria bacterium]
MRLFNRYFSVFDLALPLGDIAITLIAVSVARFFAVFTPYSDPGDWSQWNALMVVVSVIVSFYYADLYEIDQVLSQRELALRFANGFGVACLIIAALSYPIPQPGLKNIYAIQVGLMGLGLFGWRLVFSKILKVRKIRGTIAIIGMQKVGRLVAEELFRKEYLGLKVAYFVGPGAGEVTLSYGNPRRMTIPVVSPESTLSLVKREGISRILIAGPERGQRFPAHDLVTLRLSGIPVEDCHTFYERLMSKISISDLRPSWILLSNGFRRSAWNMFTKRVVDIIGSSLGLLFAAPIAVITAIAIKLDSHGPVLYLQDRAGQNESVFTLYKFRSMQCDAEVATGPQWAVENDPRATRVGRIIRKLRIDEIPQLVNVLKGEMSLVGPRPERPFFVSKLKDKIPYYALRFSVKPGITGWAQISASYADSEEDAVEKLQYDLYYVKNMSPLFDLQILFETIKVIILGRGAQ